MLGMYGGIHYWSEESHVFCELPTIQTLSNKVDFYLNDLVTTFSKTLCKNGAGWLFCSFFECLFLFIGDRFYFS